MNTYTRLALLFTMLFFCGKEGFCASFDVRFWKNYTEIVQSEDGNNSSLARVSLNPFVLGDLEARTPFADLRVVSDSKNEIPFQIVSMKPVEQETEVPCRMRNLSVTSKGDTWVELSPEQLADKVDAVQITVSDQDYNRQVEVLGSSDGKTWNTLRKDGVLFSMTRYEHLQNSRVTFPVSSFPRLAVRIINNGSKPLNIKEIRAFQLSGSAGRFTMVPATLGKKEFDSSRKESSIVVRMFNAFPIDRLLINTRDQNFQRSVTVQSRGKDGNWKAIAEGTVFRFDTPTVHASQLEIEVPEIVAKEFRLVFRNYDSPPLTIASINGKVYDRILVFKKHSGLKTYLFWNNPQVQAPHYDLAGAVTQESLDRLSVATIGAPRENSLFVGDKNRLPFTERYKVLIYLVFSTAIAGLFVLQYRVFKRTNSEEKS